MKRAYCAYNLDSKLHFLKSVEMGWEWLETFEKGEIGGKEEYFRG